jgi:dipeptidyl aminopeptidase/acylaminoacyl peptidase
MYLHRTSTRPARLLLGLLLLLPLLRAEDLIPLEKFFGNPGIADPQLSPDGNKIAFLFPKDGRMALGLFDRKTGEGRIVLEGTDDSIKSLFWKGNERIVFGGDVNGTEESFIGATDLTGKKVQRLAEARSSKDLDLYGNSAGIVSELRDDPDSIIMEGIFFENGVNKNNTELLAVMVPSQVRKINLRTKASTTLLTMEREQDMHYRGVVTDHAGVVRLAYRVREKDAFWHHRTNNNGSFKELTHFPIHGYADDWEPLGFAADNNTLWLISREEHERGALYAYNTATREKGPALFVPPEGSEIDGIVTDYHESRLLGVSYYSDRRHYAWFDKARASIQAKLDNSFKGSSCRIVSSSEDDQVHLVLVGSDRDPGAYYILDLKQPSLTLFKKIRPDVDPAKMQPKLYVSFNARDGLKLYGYLTLPAGSAGKKVPLIIHPHGGPFGVRDYWGFDDEVQFLANRGYAVLQVNYRGSGGYGRAFLDKGKRQWGKAMQDDLSDAVKWATETGIADPKRIAIYGASYGGYATLAGLTFTPELYCCGVNYVGAADLAITFKERGGDAYTSDKDFDYHNEWVGTDTKELAATSPVNFVQNIRVPSLHAYGENDPRVVIEHWNRLESELRRYNKPYQAIVEGKQGHGFSNESAAIRFYREMERFLGENLAPVRN